MYVAYKTSANVQCKFTLSIVAEVVVWAWWMFCLQGYSMLIGYLTLLTTPFEMNNVYLLYTGDIFRAVKKVMYFTRILYSHKFYYYLLINSFY